VGILAEFEWPACQGHGVFAESTLQDVLPGEAGDTTHAAALPNARLRRRAGDFRIFKARGTKAQKTDDFK
jgi:hypothetical protein